MHPVRVNVGRLTGRHHGDPFPQRLGQRRRNRHQQPHRQSLLVHRRPRQRGRHRRPTGRDHRPVSPRVVRPPHARSGALHPDLPAHDGDQMETAGQRRGHRVGVRQASRAAIRRSRPAVTGHVPITASRAWPTSAWTISPGEAASRHGRPDA